MNQKWALTLLSFLFVTTLNLALANEQSSSVSGSRAYPVTSGIEASVWLREARLLGLGNSDGVPQISPDKIAYALTDKTALLVFGLQKQVRSFGTSNRPNENVLWYFRDDGILFVNDKPNVISRANWSIVDDRLLFVQFKSKDPDGSTRITMRFYPLLGFFKSILDAAEGDYCEIGQEISEKVNFEVDHITGSSIEQACNLNLSQELQANSDLYPTMDGIAGELIVEEFREGDSRPSYLIRELSPQTVFEELVGKTVYTSFSDTNCQTSGKNVICKGGNPLPIIVFFREDGRFYLTVSPDRVISGDWMIAKETLMILRPKMADGNGQIKVQTWINSLTQLVQRIRDSKDGDFCELESGTTSAFVFQSGRFSSRRLGPTCGRRKN